MSKPNPKKLLYLSYPYPPAVSAGLFRTIRFVRFLPEYEWKPVVLTVKPDEKIPVDDSLLSLAPSGIGVETTAIWRPGEWKTKLRFWNRAKESNASIDNSGIGEPNSEDSPGGIRRQFNVLRERILSTPDAKIWWAIPSFFKALTIIRREAPNLIFSTSPPHSSHLLGVWLKRWTGLPLVLDFRDPWARSPWSGPQSHYLAKVNNRLEKKCIQRADAIILNTEQACEEFRQFYGPLVNGKLHTITNGFDPEMLELAKKLTNDVEKKRACPMKLCHVGTIYGRREIRPLLRAIAAVNTNGTLIEFEQVGTVDVDYDLDDFIREFKLEHSVKISAPVSHREALQKMAESDAIALIQPDGDLQIPGKLFEMIMFQKPIITLTGKGATRDIVSRYGLGPIAEHDDESAIKLEIESMISGNFQNTANWSAAHEAFNARNQTRQLSEIFGSILPD